jgi:hypothetical protein
MTETSTESFVARAAEASDDCPDRPMPIEQSIEAYRHILAMLALLSMESAAGTYPNVGFVFHHPQGAPPANPGYLQEQFKKIRPDVYEKVRAAIQTSPSFYEGVARSLARAVREVGAVLGAKLWCGPYPHDENTDKVTDRLI